MAASSAVVCVPGQAGLVSLVPTNWAPVVLRVSHEYQPPTPKPLTTSAAEASGVATSNAINPASKATETKEAKRNLEETFIYFFIVLMNLRDVENCFSKNTEKSQAFPCLHNYC